MDKEPPDHQFKIILILIVAFSLAFGHMVTLQDKIDTMEAKVMYQKTLLEDPVIRDIMCVKGNKGK